MDNFWFGKQLSRVSRVVRYFYWKEKQGRRAATLGIDLYQQLTNF